MTAPDNTVCIACGKYDCTSPHTGNYWDDIRIIKQQAELYHSKLMAALWKQEAERIRSNE